MAKKKKVKQPLAVNKYKHNLNRYTIVNDKNSFEAKGERYLVNGEMIINIITKQVYPCEWDKIKQFF